MILKIKKKNSKGIFNIYHITIYKDIFDNPFCFL